MHPMRLGRIWLLLVALVIGNPALAEELSIPGSGNPEHVLGELAAAFNKQQTEHRASVPPSTGTAGALRDIEAGSASLGRVGRPLKAEERSRGLSYLALGRDAVVFAAGAAVTTRNLTAAQAVDVFAGKTTDWRDLGGKPAPIRAVGREVTDASRQAINRLIKPFENLVFGENVKVVHLDPQLIELLDRFPSSLGFINRSALAACKTRVVRLAFDGIEPTPENLESGRYPLWLEFGLIYKPGNLTPAARAFIEFVQSPAAMRILRENGVVPAAQAR
ncbi:MAG: substrate-binding domain-containing protein [Sterolibacteriaceae bacterium]|nr:substrate-binding domain-containing protein [Candidatus Methylophosphatis haderslevensis]